ncbi:glycosyltransferase family 39 protein [Patescibacteria group bacterium]|nr:glycosyltransferase family 39 protein [Patescibacteria group bacterium]
MDNWFGTIDVMPWISVVIYLSLFVVCFSLIWFLFPKKNRRLVLFVFAISFLIRILYVSQTDYTTRTHDVGGHIEYISYIYHNAKIPLAADCWQCYQPPLYYFSAIPFYVFDLYFFQGNEYVFLQAYSLLLNLLFLIVGFRIITKLLPVGVKQFGSMILLGTIPAFVFSSARIGNDSLVYLCSVIFLYHFYCSPYNDHFWRGFKKLIWIFFGLLTKSTAIVLLPMWIYYIIKRRRHVTRKPYLFYVTLALFVLTICAVSGRGLLVNRNQDLLVGNIDNLNQDLKVGVSPVNFFWFDFKDFIAYPNINPWRDEGGRQYFNNYLIKSGLFGEFPISSVVGSWSSVILGLISLYIIFKFVQHYFLNRRKDVYFYSIVLFYLALAVFRFLKPFASSNDFRYIAPAYVPIIISFAKSKMSSTVYLSVSMIFAVVGIIFIVFI